MSDEKTYGLCYRLEFAGQAGKNYRVEIERYGYSGVVRDLTGQATPVTVTLDDNDYVYAPTRLSTCTLHLYGGDYLQDLYSTDRRMHRVTLLEDERVVWCGFVKPEVYTQDFRHTRFDLDVECVSAISALEGVEYKQKGERKGAVTLMELLQRCVDESRGRYEAVYVPHVYATSATLYEQWEEVLTGMSVSEQNFFDEESKAMSLLEVLQEVMKLLGWTCCDWEGALYMVDPDWSGGYYRYPGTRLWGYKQVSADRVSVQDLGFSGSNHTLDIVAGYNKVTVRCSNYPIGETLPTVDYDSMKKVGEYYFAENTGTGEQKHVVFRRTYPGAGFTALRYDYDPTKKTFTPLAMDEEVDGHTGGYPPETSKTGHKEVGALPQQVETLTKKDGKPTQTEHSYEGEILIPLGTDWDWHGSVSGPVTCTNFYGDGKEVAIITMKGAASNYRGGGFALNFGVTVDLGDTGMYQGDRLESSDFRFRLRIGDNYYHGTSRGEGKWDTSAAHDETYDNNLEIDWAGGGSAIGGGDLWKYSGTYQVVNARQLDDGMDGTKGYIMKLPEDRVLSGELELTLYAPVMRTAIAETFKNISLHDMTLEYVSPAKDDEESGNDRSYENVVNADFLQEAEDVELKISSYNNDGACYSKVMLGNSYLEDNLYCGITGGMVRPEELIVRRVVNQYDHPRVKLTQELKAGGVHPFTRVTDKHQEGKVMLVTGGELDYRRGGVRYVLTEIEEG